MSDKILLNSKEIKIILHRLACQLIENHGDFSNTVLLGIQPRGTYLAQRLRKLLEEEYSIENIKNLSGVEFAVAIQNNDKNWSVFNQNDKGTTSKDFFVACFIQDDAASWEIKFLELLDPKKELNKVKQSILSVCKYSDC